MKKIIFLYYFTVLIDYAHTPDGIENILKTAKGFAKGKVIILFGCGGDRDKSKRPLMGEIAVRYADFVILTDDNPRNESPLEITSNSAVPINQINKETIVVTARGIL